MNGEMRMRKLAGTKEKKMCRRAALLLLAIAMAAGVFAQSRMVSVAAVKYTSRRAIALVFDNSGSMYQNTAWCQAIYAMEVFASMANEGDELRIFPMHDIEVNGKKYTSSSPLTVQGGRDVSEIRQIYTPSAGGTPIETITDAYDSLKSMDADEKWLIVLTDGEEFDGMDHEQTGERLTDLLSQYNQSVNLMYLGIGRNAASPVIEGDFQNKVVITNNTADVLNGLTEMCNTIYGRDQLPIDGNTLAFDLSMNKLILFVQGSDIQNLQLTDASGNAAGTPTNVYAPSYSETGCGNTGAYYAKMASDTSLSGVIATYEDVPAGNYIMQYDGSASSIGVYYEPNVSISAFLVNEAGINVMELGDEVYPGTYQLRYGLVDENGELTDSPLLGDRQFVITYSVNGAEQTETMNENGSIPIDVQEGDQVEANVEATYLSGYYVSAQTRADWPFPIEIKATPVYDLTGTISGGQDVYSLEEVENMGVYRVELAYDKTALTGEELAKVALDVSFNREGGPDYTYEIAEDKKSILLSLKYPGNDPTGLEAQKYVMSVGASYIDEFDKSISAPVGDVAFEIAAYRYALRAEIEAKSYYEIAKLQTAAPIAVKLTHDGENLTVGEMERVRLDLDAGGLEYTTETDAENSRILVRLQADRSDAGTYKLVANVSGYDQIGQEVSAQDSKSIELQNYPLWLRILIAVLLIALILALIWFILNQKVLPKKITVYKTSFSVDGTEVTGNAQLTNYTGGKKRSGLTITAPKCPFNPLAKCGMSLDLEADSPRKVRSRDRVAMVKSVRINNGQNVLSYKIGAASFVKDEETGKFKKSGTRTKKEGDNAPLNIRLSNNGKCTISGEINDGTGNGTPMNFSVSLRFY